MVNTYEDALPDEPQGTNHTNKDFYQTVNPDQQNIATSEPDDYYLHDP
jgi:hypothetical protein